MDDDKAIVPQGDSPNELFFSFPKSAIQKIDTIADARRLADVANAVAAFLKAQGDEEQAQQAKATSLWSQRRAGELLKAMPKNTGSRGQLRGSVSGKPVVVPPDANVPTLGDLDISKNESARWQALADIPEEEFAGYIDLRLARGYELTIGALVKMARDMANVPGPDKDEEEGVIVTPKKKRPYLAWLETAHAKHTEQHNQAFDECPDRVCVLARDVELLQHDQADLLRFLKFALLKMQYLGAAEDQMKNIQAFIAKVEAR